MTATEIEETVQIIPQFAKRGGILPVAVQETATGQILMLASVNQEAFEYSFQHKVAAFYSTSKNELWVKGKTSGNYLTIDEILIDCDQDALVYKVTLAKGGVCHTFNQFGENRKACFYRSLNIESKTLEFIEK
ncbi:MAG: phosphoribosyl-AMP cyclohydrolase [Cyclobacteriaceae bacterium]|nr:phosphoribosyl-AMP cyclohydrolase [Cyclobacteriaceae bacterium]